MTDNNDPQLHDQAADTAQESLLAMKVLSMEGVHGRVGHLLRRLCELMEASWLISTSASGVILDTELPEDERETAVIALEMSGNLQAAAFSAMQVLKVWRENEASEVLSDALNSVLLDGDEEVLHRFTEIYADQERCQKIEQLNALLRDGEEGQ